MELKLKPIQAVPDKLIMEEKYDSEEKFDPGAETEAGKEAVADLDPKNELENPGKEREMGIGSDVDLVLR